MECPASTALSRVIEIVMQAAALPHHELKRHSPSVRPICAAAVGPTLEAVAVLQMIRPRDIVRCTWPDQQRRRPVEGRRKVTAWLFRQPEYLFGFVETAHRVKAERHERSGTDLGERARDQDRPQQALGEALDPRGAGNRGPEHGEV